MLIWEGGEIFKNIKENDLVLAFFPCIYFCEASQCAFHLWHFNYRTWTEEAKIAKILEREKKRTEYYSRLIKLVGVCLSRKIRIIIENPWSGVGYLNNNFLKEPSIIDMDRTRRGDFYKKPTAFWFFNCEPSNGCSFQKTPINKIKTIRNSKSATKAGLCSEERSLISTDYARNFICDFVLGQSQPTVCKTLFD